MPVIKTIGVGGDFATIALWWAFAVTQADANQWGKLLPGTHSVGSGITLLTQTGATPDANNYPRLFAADGAGFDGTLNTNGKAIITGTGKILCRAKGVHFGRVAGQEGEGPIFDFSNSQALILQAATSTNKADGAVVDGCLFLQTDPPDDSGNTLQISMGTAGAGNMEVTVQNCVFDVDGTTVNMTQPTSIATATFAGDFGTTLTLHWHHNDIDCRATTSTHRIDAGLKVTAAGASNTIIFNGKNNMAFGVDYESGCFVKGSNGTHTFTCSNNMSSDGTATSALGGTGNQDSVAASSQFVQRGSNWRLRAGASGLNAGSMVIDHDAVLRTRPYGPAVDIGAIENIPISPVRNRSRSGATKRRISAGLRMS